MKARLYLSIILLMSFFTHRASAQTQLAEGPDWLMYYYSAGTGSKIGVLNGSLIGPEGQQNSSTASVTMPLSNADECGMPIHISFTQGAPSFPISIIGWNDVSGQPTVNVTTDPTDPRPYAQGSTYILNYSGAAMFRVVVYDNATNKSTIFFLTITVHYDNQVMTITSTTTLCPGGTVNLNLVNGYYNPSQQIYVLGSNNPGFAILWSNPSQPFPITAPGTYHAYYATAYCDGNDITINASTDNATISAAGPTTFCSGGSVNLTASLGSAYLWSNGSTSQSISAGSSGSYTVAVTGSDGCTVTSSPTAVTVNPLPTAAITAGGPTTFCAGGSVTLTASAGSSYLWSNGATTPSITVNSSGSYSATVTNANGCSATSPPTSVTVNPLPSATISAGGPTIFCSGNTVALSAPSAASWLWNNGATTQGITVRSSGSYSVTVTDNNGCSAGSAPTAVTVNPAPTPSIDAVSNPDGSVTLAASGGTSYSWSTGATTATITVSTVGTYTVTASNASGCSAAASYDFSCVATKPTISLSGPSSFCSGGSVTLTASPGTSYKWSDGETTSSITVRTGGSYSVTVSYAGGCSNTSDPTTISVNPSPTAAITPSLGVDGQVSLTASGGSAYLWSSGETTPSITTSAAGTYTVTVSNTQGCSSSASYTIQDNGTGGGGSLVITPSGSTTFCAGGSVTLTAATGADSYVWSTGSQTPGIAVTAAGTYTVTALYRATGKIERSSIVVTVNPLPTASISASFGAQGAITLTAAGGSSFVWSTGATTDAINAPTPGTYNVTVGNAQGCSSTASYTIRSNGSGGTGSLTISASGATTFCAGDSVTLTAAPGAGSYYWSTGATSPAITVSAGGNYSVEAIYNATSEIEQSSTAITVNPLPTASITAQLNPDGTVALTAAGGATYAWSDGEISSTITSSAAGIYTVTVANSNGCSSTASYAITDNGSSDTGYMTIDTSGPVRFCVGGSVTLTASPNADSYQWSNGATTQSITVDSSGTYSVTALYSAKSSIQRSAQTVTVTNSNPALFPAGALQISSDTVGFGQPIIATANLSNAVQYAWAFGDGQTSTGTDSIVEHYYYQPGNLTLSMTAYSIYHCPVTYSKEITVGSAPSNDSSSLSSGNYRLNIFPNPFHDHLYLTCVLDQPGQVIVQVFLADGRALGEYVFTGQSGNNRFEFPGASALTANVLYLFRVYVNGHKYYDKLLKY